MVRHSSICSGQGRWPIGSSICLGHGRWSFTHPSVCPSLLCLLGSWSLVRLLESWSLVRLLESWSLVRLLESWSLVIHYPVCSYAADPWFVRHSSICSDQGRSSIGSSIAALSLLRCSSVAGPLLIHHWSIVDPSLVHHWSITALSARPLLSCHSSVCSSVAGPSTGVVVTGPSLVCLLLHRSSACTSPLVCRWSVADPWLI